MRDTTDDRSPSLLLIGASRGIGTGLAAGFARTGWRVVATARNDVATPLRDLATANPGRIEVERVDVTWPEQIAALRHRLSERVFDMLFVNADITVGGPDDTIAAISAEDFMGIMLTNVFGVMAAIEGLASLVRPAGLIGTMSSGQASIANNERGGYEAYRASKVALNQAMRSYAVRRGGGRPWWC